MSKHNKTVATWELHSTNVHGVDVPKGQRIQFKYKDAVRLGDVTRIGERFDGTHVMTVETMDGVRCIDCELIQSLTLVE